MTQPQNTAVAPAAGAKPTATTLAVPAISFPLCIRVWAKSPFIDAKAKLSPGDPVLWQWDKPHPFVIDAKILRMYVVPGGAIEVFSVDSSAQGGSSTGIRHTIPWHEVLLVEEGMDAKTFVEEMEAAEAGDEEEEDEEEEEEEEDEPKPLASASSNGTEPGTPLTPLTSAGGQG